MLAKDLDASVTAGDFPPDLPDDLYANAKRENLGQRIETDAAAIDAIEQLAIET